MEGDCFVAVAAADIYDASGATDEDGAFGAADADGGSSAAAASWSDGLFAVRTIVEQQVNQTAVAPPFADVARSSKTGCLERDR